MGKQLLAKVVFQRLPSEGNQQGLWTCTESWLVKDDGYEESIDYNDKPFPWHSIERSGF